MHFAAQFRTAYGMSFTRMPAVSADRKREVVVVVCRAPLAEVAMSVGSARSPLLDFLETHHERKYCAPAMPQQERIAVHPGFAIKVSTEHRKRQ
jgi:hypothetical protein